MSMYVSDKPTRAELRCKLLIKELQGVIFEIGSRNDIEREEPTKILTALIQNYIDRIDHLEQALLHSVTASTLETYP